ncbi:MAG: arsenosugar biosynthesis radical SAM (seleno)protein ArsS [Planctomycetota bacterium]|jgi:radical SAM/Cys-rich protein
MNRFEPLVEGAPGEGLHASDIRILQVNVGLKCNQQCRHCHLEASPDRNELMNWRMMRMILEAAKGIRPEKVDTTGGAPELNPRLCDFIAALGVNGIAVQVRTNLSVLLEPGMEGMPRFYRDNRVQLVGSLPCYLEANVQAQRGEGVYWKSIEAIRMLNALGYGLRAELPLDLIYNPIGPVLPGPQSELEDAYRSELGGRFGITFTRLLTITNMPIGRFARGLAEEGRARAYMKMLVDSFNPATVDKVMCRHQLSIGWDGTLYDCDFNLALGLAVDHGAPDHLSRFDADALERRRIVTDEHCFGCTAGAGSSCGGALE